MTEHFMNKIDSIPTETEIYINNYMHFEYLLKNIRWYYD